MKSTLYFGVILLSLFFAVYEKANAQSNWLWAKSIGSEGDDLGYSIAIDPTGGGVYTTGNFTGTVDFDPGPATYNLTSAGVGDIFISNWTPRVIFYGQKQ